MEPLVSGLSSAVSRRGLLQGAALAGTCWLTPLAHALADQAERDRGRRPAQSLIFLWLAGGPSQLDTFDPHPGRPIAGPARAIRTPLPGVQLAAGLDRTAERMEHLSLVRSLVSKEGDHERGTYLVKTGYRPDPTAVHPALGAVCCHELPDLGVQIPRHVSILPGPWPARGGFLGDQFDAFKVYDPAEGVPDVVPRVNPSRYQRRMQDLAVVEQSFARGRAGQVQSTGHNGAVQAARAMMTSDQLQAFDTSREPAAVRAAYGQTAFGRGCLAARRLIQVGVRCVEVTLDGWDSHLNNYEICGRLKAELDPALAALIDDLRCLELWEQTIVLCGGEFGRTPQINRVQGRDHWPHGFSMLLAGGPLKGGVVVGATDPEGGRQLHDPRQVADVHATVLAALGLDHEKENVSPVGRPIALAEGQPIQELLR